MMSINPSKYDSEVTWPHFVIGNQNGFDNALHKLNGWANRFQSISMVMQEVILIIK